MFETTSQPEESRKTGLIVGGAILVVMAGFGIFYMTHLSQEPAASAAAPAVAAARPAATPPTPEEIAAADPVNDLRIVRQSLDRDTQTQTMAMWTIRLENRNHKVAYRNIVYETNYYDAGQKLLSTRGGTFPEMLAPSDQKAFERLNDGLYPPGTASYTLEIKSAEAGLP